MEENGNFNRTVSEDSILNPENQMGTVVKNIYMSCDPENTDVVPVSKLIEFIKPYLLEDLQALEHLKTLLDPANKDKCISSSTFYEAMDEWSKKMSIPSDTDHAFNTTPKDLGHLDEKDLPYIQSTPRQSFGQKLVNCKVLLNLSDISTYNSSTTGCSDATVLEEEVKKLEHHLSKVSDELTITKMQLTAAEEQNDTLQADLERVNKRLQAETHVNELLQRDKCYSDELREELNAYNRKIEELNRKLLVQEKDLEYAKETLSQSDQEKELLEKKCENFVKKEQELRKEIINIKAGLDSKDQEVAVLMKMNDEMKAKLREHRDLVDQHVNEKEILAHEKETLEKTMRELKVERKKSLLVQFKNDLNGSLSGPKSGRPSTEYLIFSPPTVHLSKILKPAGDIAPHPLLQQLLHKRHLVNNQLDWVVPASADSPQTVEYCQDQSSEEDLFWKYEEQLKTDVDNDHESLHTEICKAESVSSSSYSFLLYEKDERMLELEEEHRSCPQVIKELNDKISLLTEENKSLQDDLEKMKRDNFEGGEKVRDDLAALLSQKILATSTQVEQHLERKNAMILELVEINKRLEEQVHVMEGSLQEKVREVIQTKQQIQRDIDMQSGLWRNMQRLRGEVLTLSKEKEHLVEERNRQTDELEKQIENLKTEINQKNIDIQSLKCDISKLTSDYTALTKENDTLKEDSKGGIEYQEQYQKINEELAVLRLEKDELTIEMENLKHQSLHVTKSKASLRNSNVKNFDKQQLTVSKLREKIEFLEGKLKAEGELRKERDECASKLKKLSDDNYHKQVLLTRLEKQLDLLRREYCLQDQKLQESILDQMDKDEHIERLIRQLGDVQFDLERKKMEMEELNDQLLLEKQKKDELFDSVQSATAELKEKDSQLADLKSMLEDFGEREKDSETKMQSLVEENKLYEANQSDDTKQRELKHLEEKIHMARTILNSTEDELKLAKNNVDECKKEFLSISKDIDKIRNVVMWGSAQLKEVTVKVFDTCENWVKISQDDVIQSFYEDMQQVRKTQYCAANIEEDLELFNKQVKVVTAILEHMACKLSKPMDGVNSTMAGEGKTLNRFTLRAPKLLSSRPASPDSPSTVITDTTEGCPKNLFEFKGDRRAISEEHEPRTAKGSSVVGLEDQLFNFTFNTMTDDLLEIVEIHDPSHSDQGGEKTENLIDNIVTNLTLDAVQISNRLEKQRLLCLEECEKYMSLLRDISNRLRDHICIGTSEPIVPVFVLIEELRLKLIEVINTMGQCGVLTYESRMAKYWNLVASYMETLKLENKSLKKKGVSYFGMALKKRRNSSKSSAKDESTTDELAKIKSSKRRSRCSCLPIPSFTTTLFLLLLSLVAAIIFVHVHCKMTNLNNKVCPLDPFIVTKRLGIPPF